MVGADLANVVNEGALMAAERGHNAVQMNDLHDALEKLVLGTERRILLAKTERRRTAYHEAGHAVVSMFTDGADPIRKVSIIPRGMALGVTLSAPGADRFSYDRNYLLGKIKVALGGRCAEEIIFDDVTTGAQNDLKQATDIARRMVGLWGMSDEVGPLSLISDDEPHLMALYPGAEPISETTLEKIDREIKRIIEEAYETVRSLLKEHRDRLDVLAARLLETETLGQDEAYAAVGLESPKLEE
jgi:cell division protease FtsH